MGEFDRASRKRKKGKTDREVLKEQLARAYNPGADRAIIRMGQQMEGQARLTTITDDRLREVMPLTQKAAAKELGIARDRYCSLLRGRVLYDEECGDESIWGISDDRLGSTTQFGIAGHIGCCDGLRLFASKCNTPRARPLSFSVLAPPVRL